MLRDSDSQIVLSQMSGAREPSQSCKCPLARYGGNVALDKPGVLGDNMPHTDRIFKKYGLPPAERNSCRLPLN